jgi:hypothetical protein
MLRVLRPSGILLAGSPTPSASFLTTSACKMAAWRFAMIPYSDLTDLDEADRRRMILDKGQPLEFGHTLEDQIGGQLDAGFVITGFYEDRYDDWYLRR